MAEIRIPDLGDFEEVEVVEMHVKEGDSITVDAHKKLIQLNVEDAELEKRKSEWVKPTPRYTKGILGKYARLVSSSSKGAVTDQS